ncbi:glycoside hydrolase family 25 protein [Saccharicrinis aurantiacus]|uniref:glycoside hydrolase family 25 protein n=1 Tax=Saccharicrinis aurantiacus TaxID=1849719 RepID=UPI002492CD60|nr:GH25 family lysozyme [Saccharicrinis aurantiacus]
MSYIFELTGINPKWFLIWVGSSILAISILLLIIKQLRKATNKKQKKINKKRIQTCIELIVGILILISTYLYIEGDYTSTRKENTYLSKSEHLFGIDISHYQGKIEWDILRTSKHPVEFIFIRASMGSDGKDKTFKNNWKKASEREYIVGAYHYYRPNENSNLQFNNFKSQVKLGSGNLPPVLDIEEASKYGSENLRKGVLNWLHLAEKHYGVKPIIYTGRAFYKQHLSGHIEHYTLWIAAYSGSHRMHSINWKLHQFTDEIIIKGSNEFVDGNFFNGDINDLQKLCIP